MTSNTRLKDLVVSVEELTTKLKGMEEVSEKQARDMRNMEETIKKQATELANMKENVKRLELECLENKKKMQAMLREKADQVQVDTETVAKAVREEVEKKSESWAKVARTNANPGKVISIQDVTDLHDRRYNLIVRGVEEMEEKDFNQRKANDLKGLEDVIKAAGLDWESITKEVEQHRRIGRREEGVCYRPILVRLRSQDLREKILRGSTHVTLKEFNKAQKTRYRLDPDLSKEQKKRLEELHEEARSKSKNGKRFYVIGKENPVLRSREMTEEERTAAAQQQER